jgi:hypothetical protein
MKQLRRSGGEKENFGKEYAARQLSAEGLTARFQRELPLQGGSATFNGSRRTSAWGRFDPFATPSANDRYWAKVKFPKRY